MLRHLSSFPFLEMATNPSIQVLPMTCLGSPKAASKVAITFLAIFVLIPNLTSQFIVYGTFESKGERCCYLKLPRGELYLV